MAIHYSDLRLQMNSYTDHTPLAVYIETFDTNIDICFEKWVADGDSYNRFL